MPYVKERDMTDIALDYLVDHDNKITVAELQEAAECSRSAAWRWLDKHYKKGELVKDQGPTAGRSVYGIKLDG